MIKKNAKGKAAKAKRIRGKASKKSKKEVSAADVRKEISEMVKEEAGEMARAVIDGGKLGQLPTVKFLFEMASIFPPSTDGSESTTDEDCLAKTLLARMNIPDEPVIFDEDDEPVRKPNPVNVPVRAPGVEEGPTAQARLDPAEKQARDEENAEVSIPAQTIP